MGASYDVRIIDEMTGKTIIEYIGLSQRQYGRYAGGRNYFK